MRSNGKTPALLTDKWKWAVIPAAVIVAVMAVLVVVFLPKQLMQQAEQSDKVTEADGTEVSEDSAETDARNQAYLDALLLLEKADAGDAAALSLIGKSENDVPADATASMLLYQAALEAFEGMDGYLDSEACVARCREGIEGQKQLLLQQAYDHAAALLEDRHYSEAHRRFQALGEFADSGEMAIEAVYRKAVGLCDVIRTNEVRGIQAELSTDPDIPSRVVLTRSLTPDSPGVEAVRSACGNDPVEIVAAEVPEENMPTLAESVSGMFASLGEYRDSGAMIAEIADLTDYSKEFYRLCAEGELEGALNWLNTWDDEIEDRELWREKLERFIPYNGAWELHSGDKTLVPLTVGRSGACYDISTKVAFEDGSPVMHLTARDGEEEYVITLYSEVDEAFFGTNKYPPYRYYLVINIDGRISYMMYKENGSLVTSCEYKRI